MAPRPFTAIVNYDDPYVQPLILSALRTHLPPELLTLLPPTTDLTTHPKPLLQWASYESLDFPLALSSPSSQLTNAYVIRKALIRKHYLAHTVHAWVVKHPTSALSAHFKPANDFELDYAEFLDDALVEAFELRAALERNEDRAPALRDWWILKPGMSDRGQGIRLFSTTAELASIFEAWEAEAPDSDDDDDEDAAGDEAAEGIVTSHLRHFVAQPYIHPPLLAAAAPFRNRKFHIRTYVVASGALRVFVYERMLALFAAEAYAPPWEGAGDGEGEEGDAATTLARMRNVHLSNTCVQTAPPETKAESVFVLDDLPFDPALIETIKQQIRATTAELFRAALAQPVNFQALPCAFEIFGLDFLVSDDPVNVWLLEVNAFPDFAQTGEGLRERVVQGLFEEVVRCVVKPYFGAGEGEDSRGSETLVEVLDMETGLK